MKALLVEEAHGLVGGACRQRRDPERPVPRRLGDRIHAGGRRHEAVEIVENNVALGQHVAVVEHQRRHPRQRIVWPDLLGIAEGRPRFVLEGEAVEPHGDADPAHIGQIILSDEDHGDAPCAQSLPRLSARKKRRDRDVTRLSRS